MDRVKATLRIFERQCKELFRKRNISTMGSAFAQYGTVGVLVGIGDKLQRFNNIQTKKMRSHFVSDETLRDTLMDLHKYAAMAIIHVYGR